jgi:hypothetical protein
LEETSGLALLTKKGGVLSRTLSSGWRWLRRLAWLGIKLELVERLPGLHPRRQSTDNLRAAQARFS